MGRWRGLQLQAIEKLGRPALRDCTVWKVLAGSATPLLRGRWAGMVHPIKARFDDRFVGRRGHEDYEPDRRSSDVREVSPLQSRLRAVHRQHFGAWEVPSRDGESDRYSHRSVSQDNLGALVQPPRNL
jgi:hypothetical protein